MSTLAPQAVSAEYSILGSMLQNKAVLDDVIDRLDADKFYIDKHREIFTAIAGLYADGKDCDVVTVSEIVGGMADLLNMVSNTPNVANVKSYVSIVVEKWMLREGIKTANELSISCYEPNGKPAIDIIADNANTLSLIEEKTSDDDARLIGDLMPEFVDGMAERLAAKTSILGYSTGYPDIDNRWGGLEGGKVYVIAGRPKMGKSTLMLNIAKAVAYQGKLAHVFSLEMPRVQVVNKLVSNASNIDYAKIRNPKLMSENDWPLMTSGTANLKTQKIIIDEQPRLSVNQIRSRIRKAIKKHGKGAAFIDYLQLMRVDDSKQLVEAIGDITSRLKEIAKSFDIPIILLSQLSRGVEARPNKRPVPSDLRSSGSIEQDADCVAFVYREEVYTPDTDQIGIAEIITSAIRDGEAGTDKLRFNGDMQRFETILFPYQKEH